MEFNHYSVLLNETIENLNIKPDGIYVDGTLGGGGHAYQVASRQADRNRSGRGCNRSRRRKIKGIW